MWHKIDSINTSDPLSPTEIAFVEKSPKEVEKLCRKAGPSKEIEERYIIQQLQLQSKQAKYIS